MIDQIKANEDRSIHQYCRVLGFRRQTYYSRKGGNRPEQQDDVIAQLLHQTTQRFIACLGVLAGILFSSSPRP
jgi:putative transposase